MGRPPCCDKLGVKKGPWTPEEDIMLVTYVQQHGPGNWRQVPTNTGLRRCSKSCRLRWTNYLRPGIRRGDFTDDEEKMIIQLQALLGNKWAAIASYLPERTDNDIKNYWNTHLKKKLRKLQLGSSGHDHDHDHNHLNIPNGKDGFSSSSTSSSSSHTISRGQWEKRLQTDIHMAKQALNDALSLDKPIFLDNYTTSASQIPISTTTTTTSKTSPQTSIYASSTENIAKLLKGFMKNTPKNAAAAAAKTSSNSNSNSNSNSISNSSEEVMHIPSSVESNNTTGIDLSEAFESLFGFDQSFGSPNNSDFSQSNTSPEGSIFQEESKEQELPLTMFENWLLDDASGVAMMGQAKAADLTNFGFDENPDFFGN